MSSRAGGRWLAIIHAALLGAVATAGRPMLSYRAIAVGANEIEIGLMATSFAVLPAVFAFGIGRRIDRNGPGRYLLLGNLAVLVGVLVAMFGSYLFTLYLGAAVIGLGLQLAVLAQQANAAVVDEADRDRAFGHMTASFAVGLTIGPPLAALGVRVVGPHVSWSEATIGLGVCLLLTLVALAPAILVLRHPTAARPAATEGRATLMALGILRTGGMWQALVTSATVLAVVDLLSVFLPLWAHDRAIPVETVGLLLGLRGLCTLACRIGFDRMLRLVGRRALLLGCLVAAAGGLALLPFVGLPGAVPIMMVLGAGLGVAQPLTMSWITIMVAAGTRAAALGIRQSANQIAQAALPATVAAIAEASGASGVFLGAAILLSSSAMAVPRAPMGDAGEP